MRFGKNEKEIKIMKLGKKTLCICLVFIMTFMLTIAPANAAGYDPEIFDIQDMDNSARYGGYGPPVILGTKNTVYGILTGSLPYYYSQQCKTEPWCGYEFRIETSIDSSVTMRRTTVKFSAVYNDTGLPGANGDWSGECSEQNSNSSSIDAYFFGESGRLITLYTTHEVSYTTAFALYTVSQYCCEGIW